MGENAYGMFAIVCAVLVAVIVIYGTYSCWQSQECVFAFEHLARREGLKLLLHAMFG